MSMNEVHLRGLHGTASAEPARLRQRSIEQSLAAHPAGLTVRGLVEEASRRELAAGRARPEVADLVTAMGLMLVSGRVDERDGLMVLCTQAGWGQRAA